MKHIKVGDPRKISYDIENQKMRGPLGALMESLGFNIQTTLDAK